MSEEYRPNDPASGIKSGNTGQTVAYASLIKFC